MPRYPDCPGDVNYGVTADDEAEYPLAEDAEDAVRRGEYDKAEALYRVFWIARRDDLSGAPLYTYSMRRAVTGSRENRGVDLSSGSGDTPDGGKWRRGLLQSLVSGAGETKRRGPWTGMRRRDAGRRDRMTGGATSGISSAWLSGSTPPSWSVIWKMPDGLNPGDGFNYSTTSSTTITALWSAAAGGMRLPLLCLSFGTPALKMRRNRDFFC